MPIIAITHGRESSKAAIANKPGLHLDPVTHRWTRLGAVEHRTSSGTHLKTGQPVAFDYHRNTEKAPKPPPGDPYGQKVEPAGRYMNHDHEPERAALPNWEKGQVTFSNPLVIRHEGEESGRKYGYQLISRDLCVPPLSVSGSMKTKAKDPLLHVCALHLADDAPYALEDRWINTGVTTDACEEEFDSLSANEWLLRNAPYTNGEIAFSAIQATAWEAEVLSIHSTSALFAIDRMTWDNTRAVTKVRLIFAPGYQLRTVV